MPENDGPIDSPPATKRRRRAITAADAAVEKRRKDAAKKKRQRANQKRKAQEKELSPPRSAEEQEVNSEEAASSTSPKRRLRTSLFPGATPLSSAERKRNSRDNQQKSKADEESRNNNGEHDMVGDDEELEDISFGLDEVIEDCVKECLETLLGSTHVREDVYRARVCVICDRIIKASDGCKLLSKDRILQFKDKITIKRYENHYQRTLNPLLQEQYQVSDEDLHGLLLSPRARCSKDGYEACCACHDSFTNNSTKSPPRQSVANGFVIGSIPELLRFKNKDDEDVEYRLLEKKLTDLLCASIAVVRPFGYVFAFMASALNSIKGHYTFFDMNQEYIGGVMNYFRSIRKSNIFCVLCGRMTPKQKEAARRRAVLDSDVFLNLLTWFIKESGHPAYAGLTPPDECPQPHVIADPDNSNNTNMETDADGGDCTFEGGSFYFSSTDDPNESTGVFDSTKTFVRAILNDEVPTLFVYGGNYTKKRELKLEDVCPIQFPFGIGGPAEKRESPVSQEECLKHYLQLSMRQFMRGDFILIVYHIYNRIQSFRTGIVKSRSKKDGTTLAERASRLTEKDIIDAGERKSMNLVDTTKDADLFLKQVTTSTAAIGHTSAAAALARRNCFAMGDYLGLQAIFATITPDDFCTVRVTLTVKAGEEVTLPSLDDPRQNADGRDRFDIDFTLRADNRLTYPGACALEYEDVIELVVRVLFRWDKKTQTGKRGIIGELEGFGDGTEEQSRKSLHSHFTLWVKHFNKIRNMLFHRDEKKKARARELLKKYVDKVMTATYGDKFKIVHACNCESAEPSMPKNVSDVFAAEEFPPPDEEAQARLDKLRLARHKNHCHEINGRILRCKNCQKEFSTVEIINNALRTWQDCAKRDGVLTRAGRYDWDPVELPLTKEHLDVVAYRYPYDIAHGSADGQLKHDHPFYNDPKCRSLLLGYRWNEHSSDHRRTCFKQKDGTGECRFLFPQPTQMFTGIDDGDLNDEKWKGLTFYRLDGSYYDTRAYTVVPMRHQGSQYLNTHNDAITRCLGCNTNMQIGDPSHTFYTTVYAFKDTQKDDNETHMTVVNQCTKHMIRRREQELLEVKQIRENKEGGQQVAMDDDQAKTEMEERASFIKGLSLFLSAFYATTSRCICSSALAHYIMMNNGTRFTFSHQFREMSVVQMVEVLEGRETSFRLRKTKTKTGEVKVYPDCFADDYLYRPRDLDNTCFYEQVMRYERCFYTFSEIDGDGSSASQSKKKGKQKRRLRFIEGREGSEGHPGYEFAYLEERKLIVIPRVSLPEGKLCPIKDLKLAEKDVATGVLLEKRESYAMLALIMFYPFRTLDDLKLNGRYWDKFLHEMDMLKSPDADKPQFWPKGIEILQNIDTRQAMEKLPRPDDALKRYTSGVSEGSDDGQKKAKERDPSVTDISQFDNDVDRDPFMDMLCGEVNLSFKGIIDRANINSSHLRDVTMTPGASSVFIDDDNDNRNEDDTGNVGKKEGENEKEATRHDDQAGENSNRPDDKQKPEERSNAALGRCTYATVLEFLCGSVVGDVSYGCDDDLGGSEQMRDKNIGADQWRLRFPTLKEVADKVEKKEGKVLDEKQRIAYEIICCSFILELIEGGELEDLFAMESSDSEEVKRNRDKLIANLEARCAEKHMKMFLTGAAGSGKSTAVEVAQRYCFEVSTALNIIWNNSFLFTSTTGSSAALFGGFTIHSASFLCKKIKNISDEDKKTFEHVRLLIVDEISYFSKVDVKKLDKYLKIIRNRHDLSFGGLPIVFSGDFHQLLPVSSDKDHLLFSSAKGDNYWREMISTIVVLENKHRFKDDPEYGELLSRMWKGELTDADLETINSRVIGRNGLELPAVMDGDVAYACPSNKERNSVNRGLFRNHIISTHPEVTSDEEPPKHTVMIEAFIYSEASENKTKKKRTKPATTRVPFFLLDRILTQCGDSDIRNGSESGGAKIDPALPIYPGAKLMATNNKKLKKLGVGNGTVCTVVGIKLRDGARMRWKNWEGRKVNTVLASDVEYMQLQHFPAETPKMKVLQSTIDGLKEKDILSEAERAELKSLESHLKKEKQARYFKLKPETYTAKASVSLDPEGITMEKAKIQAKFLQFALNTNDATTGHKLQGMSKDYIIVTSWDGISRWSNWAYTVLSRARQLKGLFLCKPLDSSVSFDVPEELKAYEQFMLEKERAMLEERERRLKELEDKRENLNI